jgi:hypothetical protein
LLERICHLWRRGALASPRALLTFLVLVLAAPPSAAFSFFSSMHQRHEHIIDAIMKNSQKENIGQNQTGGLAKKLLAQSYRYSTWLRTM